MHMCVPVFSIKCPHKDSKVRKRGGRRGSTECPHKWSVTNTSAVCVWWDCVPTPMEVRSLAGRGCVFVFACVGVCVSRDGAKRERETLSLLHKQV